MFLWSRSEFGGGRLDRGGSQDNRDVFLWDRRWRAKDKRAFCIVAMLVS